MTSTLARIKKHGKNFEIIVDLDDALKFRKGQSTFIEAQGDKIFTDSKKGNVAPTNDLKIAFGITDPTEIAKIIVKDGEVQTTQSHRDAEQEKKFKQIVDFLVHNAVDPQSGRPHTPDRLKSALEQTHVNIKNTPIETQINEIFSELSKIIPIKMQTKKIKVTIPAMHTGKAYGVLSQYRQNEKWNDNGSLEVVVVVPSGIVIDFYDKLNDTTHGSAMTEEIKE